MEGAEVAVEDDRTPEMRARKRAEEFMGLMWHVGTFVVVNLFLWFLDIVQGDGVQWAYWVTVPWGVGLAFHVVAYSLDDRGIEQRMYRKFLAEEQDRSVDEA